MWKLCSGNYVVLETSSLPAYLKYITFTWSFKLKLKKYLLSVIVNCYIFLVFHY